MTMKYPGLATATPQTTKADPRQVENSAGGYSFQIDPFSRLQRFLILGSENPTYYANARDLTIQNAQCVDECWKTDPERTATMIVQSRFRAPKQAPCIYALARGFAISEAVPHAKPAFRGVVRHASDLFSFAKAVDSMRGWGPALRKTVASFYEDLTIDDLAYQMMKYRQRDGFTHQRLIELSHPRVDPKSVDKDGRGQLFQWGRGKLDGDHLGVESQLPERFRAFIRVQAPSAMKLDVLDAIHDYNLPWEAVPTQFLDDKDVRAALVPGMPVVAFVRQLGLLTSYGVIDKRVVQEKLSKEAIQRSKIHPYSVLLARAVYEQGRGDRGRGEWRPEGYVVSALEDAFYSAFGNVRPTDKRVELALDVSSSMNVYNIQGGPITARTAAACMAMVTLRVEMEVTTSCFATHYTRLALHDRMSLREVAETMGRQRFGGTDCSLPMVDALENKREVDAFVVYTDNETWAGRQHPHQALTEYRRKMVPGAQLVVVGLTSTGFSIADPDDPGMLDVVGFDSTAPNLISDFIRGE